MASKKDSETVEDIMDSLDTLEDVLAPLLSAPLPETLSKLDVLDRAKLQTTLAYVTQDLIFSGVFLLSRACSMALSTSGSSFGSVLEDSRDRPSNTSRHEPDGRQV